MEISLYFGNVSCNSDNGMVLVLRVCGSSLLEHVQRSFEGGPARHEIQVAHVPQCGTSLHFALQPGP